MKNNQNEDKNSEARQYGKRAFLVTFKAGCLTFVIAGTALLVGLLIDFRQDSLPRWTLILLGLSLPFTLGGVYLVANRAIKRARKDQQAPGIDDNPQDGQGDETFKPL
jgi:hypothetical protein